MKIKVWGCRGSIPTSGADMIRAGGNSTCLEIRTAAGGLIIVDAGSGLRNLGKALCREKDVTEMRFFFTHSHWDHLIGFPFFQPAYFVNFSINFCSGQHSQSYIRKYLSRQMEAPYSPVDFSHLRARMNFHCVNPHREPRNCLYNGIEVCPVPLNHPNGGYGYKFIEGQKSFIFLPDNELSFSHDGGLKRAEYAEFCRGADLLFHDAQYTSAEYGYTRGWGHSTYDDAADLALRQASNV